MPRALFVVMLTHTERRVCCDRSQFILVCKQWPEKSALFAAMMQLSMTKPYAFLSIFCLLLSCTMQALPVNKRLLDAVCSAFEFPL
jgi:hypothetical protein